MSELKRCPFCGGEPLLEHDDLCNWFVRCKKCFCRTPMSISKFFPITIWNTRKPMDRIVERLEELKAEALREYKEFLDGEDYRQSLLLDKVIKTAKEEGGV